ncbi:hypothetical protein K458DRAFT_181119 [Lentithecium fluviatile CBS 122367]|uniref:Uncharacterized protein n=1 Tax=Lentithecium fluviatile CBS 122367 TaxID=1168545 RepID=A0A6G1IEW8_9PLEO|nr:hypothetical protein K458DRAFT_181119 [Lentithecium fluviatile CBS 122367]
MYITTLLSTRFVSSSMVLTSKTTGGPPFFMAFSICSLIFSTTSSRSLDTPCLFGSEFILTNSWALYCLQAPCNLKFWKCSSNNFCVEN